MVHNPESIREMVAYAHDTSLSQGQICIYLLKLLLIGMIQK